MSTHAISEEDSTLLFDRTASFVFEKISGLPGEQVVLGLCGGRSIVGLLEAMARTPERLPAGDWRRLHFFMVDERLVSLEDNDSNYRQVHQEFLGRAVEEGLLFESQLHPFRFRAEREDSGVGAYEAELAEYGGRFDIAFLGVGEDGHVAGMFPGGPWLQSEAGFIAFDDAPKPPPDRMTSTPALLRKCRLAVGLFIGEGKREALRRFRSSGLSLAACPAKILNEVEEALVVTDLV